MAHRRARLNVFGRQLLVMRVEQQGWTAAQAADALGVTRTTAYKWLARYRAEALALLMALGATTASAASPRACLVRNAGTGQTYTALQAAVDTASRGDRLTVRGTCHGPTVIDKGLVIEGIRAALSGKPTLSGGGRGRVVEIGKAVRVVMRDLIIRDGRAWTGAGILNRGFLVLGGATAVSRNTARLEGGGVKNMRRLTLDDASRISVNRAVQLSGGGVSNGHRGIVTMNDASRISGNVAWNSGGVYVREGTLTMNGTSTISGNTAKHGGGVGLYRGTLVMNDASTIIGNTSMREGGGVSGGCQGTVVLNGSSSIRRNTARGLDSFGALTGGGGVENGGGTVTLNDTSTITGNRTNDIGGGVYNYGCNDLEGSLTMTGSSTIIGNIAKVSGGGVLSWGPITGVICAPNDSANVYGNSPDDCHPPP